MGMIYFTFDSNKYQTLRISGSTYPTVGTIRGTFNSDVDPASSTPGWSGPWSSQATKPTTIIIEDLIDITYGQSLFYGMSNVTTLKGIDNISGGLINGYRMFAGMSKLTNILDSNGDPANFELPNLKTVNCTNMEEMFCGTCSLAPRKLILQGLATNNTLNTKKMFEGSGFTEIDMQLCNTHSVINSVQMFANCSNLTTIYGTYNYFDFGNATSSIDMFSGSPNIPNAGKNLNKSGAVAVSLGGHIDIQIAPQTIAKAHIKLRYDTLANWETYNPILMAGEVAIDKTTHRIKVGDGVQHFKDLPYYGSPNVDNTTLKMDSEGMLYANIDGDTIYYDITDGVIKSKQVEAKDNTIQVDTDGKIYLQLDSNTMEMQGNYIAAKTLLKADNKTILNRGNTLSVPIDEDTIFIGADGKLVAKGDMNPGKALDWDGTTRVLDVRYDDKTLALQGDGTTHGYLSVNYDGKSIWWNPAATGTNTGGGALSGHYSVAGDGVAINDVVDGNGKKQTISVKVDDNTIKIVDGKLTAQAVPPVAGEAIEVKTDGTINVLVDDDTIKIVDNKLTVGDIVPSANAPISIDADNKINLDFEGALEVKNDKLAVKVDDDTIKIVDDKLTVQPPKVDSETIYVDADGKLKVNAMTQTEFDTFWGGLF